MTTITDLINTELERARAKHPAPINSSHEGYAVLLEEIEEMQDEFKILKSHRKELWDCVKDDDIKGQKFHLVNMRSVMENLIKEAVQVGAMLEKYQQDYLD